DVYKRQDLEFLYATLLLEQAQREGAKVFNRPQMLRDHNEKLAILEFPQFIADTLVSRDPQRLRAFVQHHRLAIFKLLDGMGVMSVNDASQVKNLNRKQRNKMAVVKEGLEVSQVLLQEGVPTIEQLEGSSAEPVVYMIDRYVVGGFYRIHAERGPDENLNAPGMKFLPLPFDESCMQPDQAIHPDAAPNRYYVYGVIARLALLAASLELEQARP
ncbi:MAG: hypothetical protein EBW14_17810, partial [Oxalobacteraceae bacterium]|nr:hypothetical protein [Oxalobacteraceae bacterium]